MAQRFHFDDEFEEEIKKEEVKQTHIDKQTFETKPKKIKKKKKLKPWVIVLLTILLICLIFVGYVFLLANNDGPVYGSRCDGVTTVNIDARNNTITQMKKKYSQIKDLTIEVTCRQIKIDITFEDKMSTKKGISIGEEVVKTLDKEVGLDKDEGKTYSQLFGYLKNEAQYDCQLILMYNDSKDYIIYGTKHHNADKFSYTYSSVKDEDSKEKAEETLKKE